MPLAHDESALRRLRRTTHRALARLDVECGRSSTTRICRRSPRARHRSLLTCKGFLVTNGRRVRKIAAHGLVAPTEASPQADRVAVWGLTSMHDHTLLQAVRG